MSFSMKLTPRVEHVLWGMVGGVALTAAVGFMFFGWVTGGKATTMAREAADKAVIAALAPICVENFRQASNAGENLGKLKAISYSWEQGTYVSKGGWATMPGNPEPNQGVAQACAETLSSLAK